MVRQRLALWFALRRIARSVADIFANTGLNRPCDLFFLERQFKLIEGFGPRAEAMAAQARQLMLQLLDPVIALFDLGLEDRQLLVLQGDHRLQRSDIIGQIGGSFAHQDLYQNPAPEGIANPQVFAVFMGKYRLSGSQRTPGPRRCAPVDPLQQHRQLRRGQRHLSGRRRGPYEPAFLQALGK